MQSEMAANYLNTFSMGGELVVVINFHEKSVHFFEGPRFKVPSLSLSDTVSIDLPS